MSGGPLRVFEGQDMRKSALELGQAQPLMTEEAGKKARAALLAKAKEPERRMIPPAGVRFIPQPISFKQLKSYQNPFHSRCLRIKARMSVGLGFEEEAAGGQLKFPLSAKGDTLQQQLVLSAMDVETMGNGYLEIVTATGGEIDKITWLPGETMEVSEDSAWYRHVVSIPGSAFQRVTFYPAWPRGGKPEGAMRYCLHTAQDGTWSTWYGEPDWLGCLQSVMLFDGYMRYKRALLDNNCIPTWLILVLGAGLSDEKPEDPNNAGHYLPSKREEFVTWMKGTYGGPSKVGGAMLLDGLDVMTDGKASIQFQKLQEELKGEEMLKALDTMRDHILSCHGVPPRLAGVVASGSLGGSGELFGQLLAFREDLRPKKVMHEQALSRLLPFLPAPAPKTLTLRELDIEPFRGLGSAPAPTLPADSSAAKIAGEVDRILREAGAR